MRMEELPGPAEVESLQPCLRTMSAAYGSLHHTQHCHSANTCTHHPQLIPHPLPPPSAASCPWKPSATPLRATCGSCTAPTAPRRQRRSRRRSVAAGRSRHSRDHSRWMRICWSDPWCRPGAAGGGKPTAQLVPWACVRVSVHPAPHPFPLESALPALAFPCPVCASPLRNEPNVAVFFLAHATYASPPVPLCALSQPRY